MTSDIRFTDEEFSFKHNGVTYFVHTEVGHGPAEVIVKRKADREPQPELEQEEPA